ncbi:dipeptide ABC transporter ATP-binding protein [Arthrobacter sp. MYb23]|uniref:ABC transporter ATP-binding protein n=1 Tax=unclassified Arthrobacter TaxID=235627 RepID=UPI000CFC1B49|nr:MULTISPECIES: ABC transporter ATP-binding protein [unclassified Arthrobacter]PRB36384.1 dipeptide ABC transporter ATP-binding protein [Arthrobacter sp. MYb51]PRB94249.1 dipeptide ABC transporter ATP-binding protein [Arthrobacter sp. MYb23]
MIETGQPVDREVGRVLDVRDLAIRINAHGQQVEPVAGVSFHLNEGETLGLVGESGCGKSMTGLAIMGMLPPGGSISRGSIALAGDELVGLGERAYRQVRGNDIAMIFQDSMTSLNPTKTIGYQIAEPVRIHRGASNREALERAAEVLSMVGIARPRERMGDYPHQLSGGMRQRVMIAMALACEPKVVIADEPTTALDVTIQAQVLELLDNLKAKLGMSMVLITHDMGVVASRADRVNVMYSGRIAEIAGTEDLFSRTRHPYTRDLLASIPLLGQDRGTALYSIKGIPPDLAERQSGCRYAPRCQNATAKCHEEEPVLAGVSTDHLFACWNPIDGEGVRDQSAQVQIRSAITKDVPTKPRLSLVHLVKEYRGSSSAILGRSLGSVKAVSDVSLTIGAGETYGLVGESGCGKTTLGRMIVGLEAPTSGKVLLDGKSISHVKGRDARHRQREIQMMFQDPYGSLDPRMKVSAILAEPLVIAGQLDAEARRSRVAELLDHVGLPLSALKKLPHEMSGGQRQRIGLARALAVEPRVLVADEPVSALDVSIRSQVLNLMRKLQNELGLTSLVISHDLAVVKYLADRIGVMYLGKLVEEGTGDDIYKRPAHPYTAGLIAAIPEPDPAIERGKPAAGVRGELPSPISPPSGCRFRTRCPMAQEICTTAEPPLAAIQPGHRVACHFPLSAAEAPGGANRAWQQEPHPKRLVLLDE